MTNNNNNILNKEGNVFTLLIYKYLPFWPLFAILIAISLLGAWTYLRFVTPVYEASATLIINDEKKGVDESKMLESLNIYTSTKIVENEIEVIRSRALMKQVVNKLNLYAPVFEEGSIKSASAYLSSPIIVKIRDLESLKEYPEIYFSFDNAKKEVTIRAKRYPLDTWVETPYGVLQFAVNSKKIIAAEKPLYFSLIHPSKIINSLTNRLLAIPASKLSTVVNLRFTDHVPQRGEDILNQIIYSYNQKAINDRNTLAANTLDFIEDRIKFVEGELRLVENEVQKYKSDKRIFNLSEQGKLFLQNVSDNDRKIADIGLQLAVLDKVEKYVVSKNKDAGIVPSTLGINDPVLSQLLEKLYDSENQYEKLKKTTAENNPILVSLSNEINRIRPSILENISNQRINLEASRNNLSSTTGSLNSVLQTIPQKERELLEISRQQTIKNNVYSFLLQKREETALSYASNIVDSRIVDMAESSILPVSPKKYMVFLIAILVACSFCVAFITGRELLSRKILFRSEIETYTSIPVIAEFYQTVQKKGVFFDNNKDLFIADQFGQLRSSLGLYGRTFQKKKIMVTSSISGEGKSFISTNLALSLALSNKKVVLLDMDLRNPKSSFIFNLSKQKGITEFLYGELETIETINKTSYKNLYVVPAGEPYINSTELLLSERVEELLGYLEVNFDYIIIDSPPVGLVSDALLLSEFCDKTLFVVRHAYTPKNIVQLLDLNNKIKSLKDLGIVFNGVKPRGFFQKGYGFGYGYGYENIKKQSASKNLFTV